jgi:hypothetical protein
MADPQLYAAGAASRLADVCGALRRQANQRSVGSAADSHALSAECKVHGAKYLKLYFALYTLDFAPLCTPLMSPAFAVS